jgi:HSP20 family protein
MSSENAITTTNANEIDVQRQEPISRANRAATSAWTYRPDVDIIEEADHYLITLDVPGVRPEEVDLSIERDVLTLHACVNHGRSSIQRRWMRQEYGVGDYFRRFQLDETVNAEAIIASCENGVLTITLPKHAAARPKRITVTHASRK